MYRGFHQKTRAAKKQRILTQSDTNSFEMSQIPGKN